MQEQNYKSVLQAECKKQKGFYSKKYEDKGFSPANPLSFENQDIMHTAASLVIKSFAYQEIQQKQMNKNAAKSASSR